MKVILSRKGFDSEFGGHPSPILPDGRLISLPIPDPKDLIRYSELKVHREKTYYDLMSELGMKIDLKSACHLDPDLDRDIINRQQGWKPLFGQINSAQGHLDNKGVEVGDLFLFFGWFRKTKYQNGKLVFSSTKTDCHVIFGYLQIGRIIKPDSTNIEKWMKYHPHIASGERRNNKTNTVYIASSKLSFDSTLPGGNIFNFNEKLVLTKKGCSRSKWDLDPKIFKEVKISYHPDPWRTNYFQSANKGQEFVIEEDKNVENWAKNLIDLIINYKNYE